MSKEVNRMTILQHALLKLGLNPIQCLSIKVRSVTLRLWIERLSAQIAARLERRATNDAFPET
jgi:hypothetical protein